jgi:hypothetical protein
MIFMGLVFSKCTAYIRSMKMYFTLSFLLLMACTGPTKPSDNEQKPDTIPNTTEYRDTDGGNEQTYEDSLSRSLDKVQQLVTEWNELINKQDLNVLKTMYTENLQYYLEQTSAEKCIASKEKWLQKHPGYHQEIRELNMYFTDKNDSPIAAFQKVFVDKDTQKVESALFFARVNGEWKITKETDLVSEVVAAKKLPAVSLANGDHSFLRTIWRDARAEGMVTKYSKLEYVMDVHIKNGVVSGTMTSYSRSSGGIEVYNITKGKTENGMLEFTTEWERYPSEKETLHFKIASESALVCTDKDQLELFGQPLVRFKR